VTQPDIYDLLAEDDAEAQPTRGPWPHFIDGVPAHGITSMTPPTVRCDGCGTESSHPTSIHLAVLLDGMYFRQQRYGADPRRLCRACAWDAWPEKRTSDHGTPIPRPTATEAARTTHTTKEPS
jgi:hypothetical protein